MTKRVTRRSKLRSQSVDWNNIDRKTKTEIFNSLLEGHATRIPELDGVGRECVDVHVEGGSYRMMYYTHRDEIVVTDVQFIQSAFDRREIRKSPEWGTW